MFSGSVVSDSVTPWTAAHQAPPSMEFSRQEYWSGLPFPTPGDLSDPGLEPAFLHLLHGRQILYHRATFYNALLKGFNKTFVQLYLASLMAQQQRIHTCNAGDTGNVGSISGSGRSLGEGNGNPLQYFAWEISYGQRSLAVYSPWAHKSQTQLSD